MNRFLSLLLAAWMSGNCFLHCVSVIDVWPKENQVTEGKKVVINCSQSSNNSNITGLNFTWSKLGTDTLLSNSSQLTITNIRRGDSGNYSCTATNGTANWSAVAIASITVLYPPQIDHSTRNLTVNESSTTNLFCNASGYPSPAIHWTLPNGSNTVLSNNEFLELKKTSRHQHGRYSCRASNKIGNSSSAVVYLNVQYPPQIDHSTRNLTVNESSTTNLFCNASGYPSPAIHWTLPNGSNTVLSNNEFLELKKTSRHQHGRYSCRASNKIGNSSSAVVYLNVQYKPQINTSVLPNKIGSWLHRNSTLICLADGNPVPVVKWSKDDRELFRGNTSGRIEVIPKNSTDFGFYNCTARNALGRDEFRVEVVREAFPPDPPEILNEKKQLRSQNFTLRWSMPENNGRPIFGYFVYQRELNSNSSKGTLEKKNASMNLNYNFTLKWATAYEFIVTATNDQGESTKNNAMNFTVISEPTTRATTQATKPTASTTDSSDRKPNILLYAGIAVGVGLFLVIVIIVTILCAKRMRQRDQASLARPMQPLVTLKEVQKPLSLTNSPSPRLQNANTYNAMPKTRVSDISERRPKKQEQVECASPTLAVYTNLRCLDDENPDWEFPRENVHIKKYVGKGAFCVVAKAFVDTLGIVAVKTPKEKAPESNKKDLLAEYELMKQLRHPNVIRLMGAVTRSDPVMVMFEYIPYGDLLGFLKRSRGLDDKYYKDPDVKPSSFLKSKQLLKFAREIADGMAYLAASKIIHRDLAARNVLVGEEETCKITDFGMARDVQQHDIYQKRSKGRLPVKWTAIESLLYGVCTTQSDVWSYGIVLYEIFTIGGKPYPNIQGHRVPYMLKDNYRMPKPVHLDDEIYALMSECWQTNPNSRPTFDSISTTLKRLQGRHKEIIYMNVYDDELYSNVDDWD